MPGSGRRGSRPDPGDKLFIAVQDVVSFHQHHLDRLLMAAFHATHLAKI